MKNIDLFLEPKSIAYEYIMKHAYPYEVLPEINNFIFEIASTLGEDYKEIESGVWVHKTATLHKFSTIEGPCIIDEGATLRPGAYIRGNVIVGKGSVVGNSCEIKNAILFDKVEVPHFNYVGDSILGYKSHLGAGVVLSNLKSDKKNVVIDGIETGLRKVGSFLGDYVEVGCNSVLNPGTVIYPYTSVYPLVSVRGVIAENMIVKSMDNIVPRKSAQLTLK